MPQVLDLFASVTAQWFGEAVGKPTAVQEEGWPAIAAGGHVLISAPTGSGKTLAAFLVLVDRLKEQARQGVLQDGIHLIYVSPLKALGNDIRENLKRPLSGIGGPELKVAIRTGDTSQADRRRMIKQPPHILITTPESLYLLLTSKSGQEMLKTARTVILDELHAVINSKRGAHLMFSLARLDKLCGQNLQRIGLSATIEPLAEAAAYLAAPDPVTIVAPKMVKQLEIEVNSPLPDMRILTEGTIWPDLARSVLRQAEQARTVIVFVEGRMHAEKLAYYLNEIAGEGFARTHHGCVSKEQRLAAEQELRSGKLRILCATSSMELGIDVGEVDLVLQIGYPRTISSAMQRLGRAGHNPGRVSVMHMLPRTAAETLYCGLTASLAVAGGIEQSQPPRKCLDVLAQHLVSMATGDGYTVDEIMELLPRAYSFREVTREEVERVLRMLAGDYEHKLDRPARPRLLYDRIHGTVEGDAYSRMLALSTGGTIPDRGFFGVHLLDGAKIGELDEEFVFEARVGDKFMLGSFAWRIRELGRDRVLVEPASPEGAQPPFWKGDPGGRPYQTGLAFGSLLRGLTVAHYEERLPQALQELKMDHDAVFNAQHFLTRQFEATGCLPDDQTILVEHFQDEAGESQIMVHSIFGKRVNAGLALLTQEIAQRETGMDIACYDDDDGYLVFPYAGGEVLPDGLLQRIKPEKAREILVAMLPATALFNMAFRYNAGRALMMGVRKGQRQPLWVQRLKGAEVLDGAIGYRDHPLVEETRRECLENYWDLAAIEMVLQKIRDGRIAVKEFHVKEPSPLSLPFRRQAEAVLLYDYTPTTSSVFQVVEQDLSAANTLPPAPEQLERVGERQRMPENAQQLHTLLMTEGDLLAGELDVPLAWLEELAAAERACYIEPGLWIAAEQLSQYQAALVEEDGVERQNLVRRCLRYRGPQDMYSISERYFWLPEEGEVVLQALEAAEMAIEQEGLFYHAELYSRAQRQTVLARRRVAQTLPPARYAAFLASRIQQAADPPEQLKRTLQQYLNQPYPPAVWEQVILPARVTGYRGALLDQFLAQGELFWQYEVAERPLVHFHRPADIDWQKDWETDESLLNPQEKLILQTLRQRGASFSDSLAVILSQSPLDTLLALTEKGLVHADSFAPLRHLQEQEKQKKAPTKRRAKSRAVTLSAGRWELARPLRQLTGEELLEQAFARSPILCRETAQGLPWGQALELLRIWEYTGRVRRGYFIQGLSGAQFIREQDYAAVLDGLETATGLVWLNAADPSQLWGKAMPHLPERDFLNVSGTAVALQAGIPVAALERQGKVLRVFEEEGLTEILTGLAKTYQAKRLFPHLNRLTIKEYPAEAEEALQAAGFSKQMLDYVLWQ